MGARKALRRSAEESQVQCGEALVESPGDWASAGLDTCAPGCHLPSPFRAPGEKLVVLTLDMPGSFYKVPMPGLPPGPGGPESLE